MGSVRPYLQFARLAFQRRAAYRLANFTGVAVNFFFLMVHAQVLLAFFRARPERGGLGAEGRRPVLRGVGVALDGDRDLPRLPLQPVRAGAHGRDRDSDLARPVRLFWRDLAERYGTGAYFLLTRVPAVFAAGWLVFGVTPPLTPGAAALPRLARAGARGVGGALVHRLLVGVLARERDRRALCGRVRQHVPRRRVRAARLLPAGLRVFADVLPFRATLYTPVAILTGKLVGRRARLRDRTPAGVGGAAGRGLARPRVARTAPARDAGRLRRWACSSPRARVAAALHALASASLRSQMQYRAPSSSARDRSAVVIDLAPVWILARFFGHLEGWSFAELALLYGMVASSWATSRWPARLRELLDVSRAGRSRPLLLAPARRDPAGRLARFEVRKLGRIAQALVVLAIAACVLRLGARALAWVALGVAGGLLFFAGVVIVGAAIAVLDARPDAGVAEHADLRRRAAFTYPVSIYSTWFRRVLTYGVPLAFVNYFPALAALGRDARPRAGRPSSPWLSPFVCLVVLLFGLAAFTRGLRRYESTGS